MTYQQIIDWLLQGDVAIQYQTWRDLLGNSQAELQQRIAVEGWGHKLLSARHSNGHWGSGFYQPKWISTHYTLLDLRNLCLPVNNALVHGTLDLVLKDNIADDGGLRLGPSTREKSDVCVNAMFLNYASYFQISEKQLQSVVDNILHESMPDGGFNCRTTRSGAVHSSLHTTLSVLEGFTEFQKAGHTYKKQNIRKAIASASEFILMHRLFLSDRTGRIIHDDFLKLRYPCRWKYDILRAMDYFQYAGAKTDPRMASAMEILTNKRNKEGTWNLSSPHVGQVHVVMEKTGQASRWNTLRMLRVLKEYSQFN